MLILLRLDPHDAGALKAYRFQVKERLYRFNFVSCDFWWEFTAGYITSNATGGSRST